MHTNLMEAMRRYWGYDRFLPLQEAAMVSVREGRDSIVVLPTGGGKSLCYQVPAAVMPGFAVVVSPLISLMKDQVDALAECGLPAGRIDSSLSPAERDDVLRRIRGNRLKLLYLAPERLVSPGFIDLLRSATVSFIAIDEAHCISLWGHDFRPEYRDLRVLKDVFPGIGIHAYTATATVPVRTDIAQQLRLEQPEVLIGSFDRPNLCYRVQRRSRILDQVCSVLNRHKGESGIVYAIRRADVDSMCRDLTGRGYRVLPYHAGMDDEARRRNQEAFVHEDADTIVATVAFGMGIDKSNVRYVVHAGMPKSIEHYQQESGRAGRDGLEAECCLFYSGADYGVWRELLSDVPPEAASIALAKLREIYHFCTGVECRRRVILTYFGQELGKENCGACDVCLGHLDLLTDSLVTAQKILSCVVRLRARFGGDYTASVLIGSRDERILALGHDKLTTYGLLSEHPKRVVRDWIEQLVAQDCLRKAAEFNLLQVTEKGWRVLKGLESPRLLKPADRRAAREKRSRRAEDSWEGVDHGLFEHLRGLRRRLAGAKHVPAFIVFGDATLRDMARHRPSTTEHFLKVHGVGLRKCDEYGARFVAAIREYCTANAIPMDCGQRL